MEVVSVQREDWAVRTTDFFLSCVLICALTGMKGGVRRTLEAKLCESGRCVQRGGARADCTGKEEEEAFCRAICQPNS